MDGFEDQKTELVPDLLRHAQPIIVAHSYLVLQPLLIVLLFSDV